MTVFVDTRALRLARRGVHRRLGVGAVRDSTDRLLRPIEVAWVDRGLHEAALTALLAADRRGISLVDRASFEMMRRATISTAVAFDRDLEDAGFDLAAGG